MSAALIKAHRPHLEPKEKRRKSIDRARLGKRVTGYSQVDYLANHGFAVAVPSYGEILPAAWILGMQYRAVHQRIESGMFIYRKAAAK